VTKKGSTPGGPSSRRSGAPTAFEQEFPGGSESANASVIALVRTYGALIAVTNKAMGRHGISAAGRQALAIIEGAGEPLAPTVIAQRLLVTTASTSSLLDTLERKGLVTRLPDPDDRRGVLVALTVTGQEMVDEFLPQLVALQTAALSRLSETDREQFQRSLAVIQDTVAELDSEAVVTRALPRSRPKRP
jgi:DNA-binding MarR family transcriptional regulator